MRERTTQSEIFACERDGEESEQRKAQMCVCVCVCVAACRRSFSLYVDLLGMLAAGESEMKSYSFGDELMGLSNIKKTHREREREANGTQ